MVTRNSSDLVSNPNQRGTRMTYHIVGFLDDGGIKVSSSLGRMPPIDQPNYFTVESPEGLRVLSTKQIVSVYNYLTKGKTVKDFETKEKGINRLWELLCTMNDPEGEKNTATDATAGAATTETTTTTTTTTGDPAPKGKGKGGKPKGAKMTEAEKADAKAKKEKEKLDAAAAKTEAPKEPGVIDSIVEFLKDGGGTVAEIVKKLKARFPARTEDGMTTTVKIQLTRLVKNGKVAEIKSEKTAGEGDKAGPTRYWIEASKK